MSPRKAPSDEQLREAFSEVGDALQRAVVLSSDRVQSVFEDAVLRGRMTRRDAEELATSLLSLGRDQAQELRTEVDSIARALPGKITDAVKPGAVKRRQKKKAKEAAAATPAKTEAPAKKATPAARKPKAAKPAGAPDPASASAKDLIALTATLGPTELGELRLKEAAGKNRATVLAAIDKKLSA